MILLIVSEGIANPMPWANGIMAVLSPITLPSRSASGPPLLPGLIAASVWIRPSTTKSVPGSGLPRAPIRPIETVGAPGSPRALPIARTIWPTLSLSESASVAKGRFSASTFTSATSVAWSVPITSPTKAHPVLEVDLDLRCVVDHVVVRDDDALGVDDDPRALALHWDDAEPEVPGEPGAVDAHYALAEPLDRAGNLAFEFRETHRFSQLSLLSTREAVWAGLALGWRAVLVVSAPIALYSSRPEVGVTSRSTTFPPRSTASFAFCPIASSPSRPVSVHRSSGCSSR